MYVSGRPEGAQNGSAFHPNPLQTPEQAFGGLLRIVEGTSLIGQIMSYIWEVLLFSFPKELFVYFSLHLHSSLTGGSVGHLSPITILLARRPSLRGMTLPSILLCHPGSSFHYKATCPGRAGSPHKALWVQKHTGPKQWSPI